MEQLFYLFRLHRKEEEKYLKFFLAKVHDPKLDKKCPLLLCLDWLKWSRIISLTYLIDNKKSLVVFSLVFD